MGFKPEKPRIARSGIRNCHILYQIWLSSAREIENVILNKRMSACGGYLYIWLKMRFQSISK